MFHIGIEDKINPKDMLNFFCAVWPNLRVEIYQDCYTYPHPLPDILIQH